MDSARLVRAVDTPSPIESPLGSALTDVELAELRYFHCVASTRSFARGAQLAHVSASAISKAIKRLEAALGVELLRRTTRRVHVTEAGEMLMAYCNRILGAVDDLSAELDARRGLLRGTVRIGTAEIFATHVLPRALGALAQAHPDLLVKTFDLGSDATEQALLEGELDVAFTAGDIGGSAIARRHLGTSPGVLVCGREHPLYSAGSCTPEQLAQHPFVVPLQFGREHRMDLDGFADPRRRIGTTAQRLESAIRIVCQGAFVGYMPAVAVREELNDGRLRTVSGVDGGQTFELNALTRPDEQLRPAVVAVIDAVASALHEALAVERAA